MIKYGMDATIVVHEATFEDKMWKEAKMKNHSTTKHAIEMALKYVITSRSLNREISTKEFFTG
jgi:ribonuclease BN (tRNA processing enzyme)